MLVICPSCHIVYSVEEGKGGKCRCGEVLFADLVDYSQESYAMVRLNERLTAAERVIETLLNTEK